MSSKPAARRVSMILGVSLLAGGTLIAANGICAGPHAFALGWKVVIAQVAIGLVCLVTGGVELRRAHRS